MPAPLPTLLWGRMDVDNGVPSGPGLRPYGTEPQAAQAKPLVPDAGNWAIVRRRSYGWSDDFDFGQIDTVKPKTIMVKTGAGRRLNRFGIDDVFVMPDEETARQTLQRIGSAKGEAVRRQQAAHAYFKRQSEALIAQGMSAGTAKTVQPVEGEARQRGPQDAPVTPCNPHNRGQDNG